MTLTLLSLLFILLSNSLALNNISKPENHDPVVAVVNTPTNTPTPTLMPSPIPTATLTPTTSLPTLTLTPTPTLTPIPIISSGSLEDLFTTYSALYNVDKEMLKKIAKCESGFNTNAVNLDYGGMFQFASSSWIGARNIIGLNNDPGLRFNAEEAIKTAAFVISQRGTSAWANCD